MQLIFHIGTEKAGSTSLQTWLHKHRDALRGHGIWFSRVAGHGVSRKIAAYGRDLHLKDDHFGKLGLSDEASHKAWRRQFRADLRAEIGEARRAGTRAFILSSEHCHSRLTSTDMVSRVGRLLKGQFTAYTILLILRPQVDLSRSRLSEVVRSGHFMSEAEARLERDPAYYDYLGLYDRWHAVFPNAVRIFPLKRYPDTVALMRNILGVPASDFPDVPRERASIGMQAAMLNNSMSLKKWVGGAENPLARLYLPPADMLTHDQPLTFDQATARAMHAQVADRNVALAQRIPELSAADLTPDFESYPRVNPLEALKSPCPFSEALTLNVKRFNALNLVMLTRALLSEARTAFLEERTEAATSALKNAYQALQHTKGTGFDDIEEMHNRQMAHYKRLITDVADTGPNTGG